MRVCSQELLEVKILIFSFGAFIYGATETKWEHKWYQYQISCLCLIIHFMLLVGGS